MAIDRYIGPVQPRGGCGKRPDGGVALLMVLWILAVLTVTVLSFSYTTRSETYAAISFREGVEKKFLAEGGIERGLMEIIYRKTNASAPATETSGVWKTDGTAYPVTADNGSFVVSIMNESGKVDINTTPELILRNLFANLGLSMEEVDTIVDSIGDWRDADDLVRLHGAESDYYMSLPTPYKPRNADFQTLEELLLVKGVTPQILYGGGEKKGVIDYLTVYSRSTRINVNAAPKEVLLAVPGMTTDAADAILALREARELTGQDMMGIIGQSYSQMSSYIDVAGLSTGGVFTVTSKGMKGTDTTGYAIKATVSIDAKNNFRYLYYKSPAATQ